MNEKFSSRKFLVTMYIATGAMALCAFGKMDGGACSAVLLFCAGLYNWANAKVATVEGKA